MTTLLLVGAGALGARTARQLVDTHGVDELLVADRDGERATRLARSVGATPIPIDRPWPAGVVAVVGAVPEEPAAQLVARALAVGVPSVTVAADLAGADVLDQRARDRSLLIVVGAGFGPGLTDVLARHAADAFDEADEVHVAYVGAAGPACEEAMRRARRAAAVELRDGALVGVRRRGSELVWFPDPVGARECDSVASGVVLLHQALPEVGRVVARAGAPSEGRSGPSMRARRSGTGGWGAVRVEVWGRRGDARHSIAYGVIDRPAVAAGTTLAVTGARLAGLLPDLGLRADATAGLRGLGAYVEPVSFLTELAARGVKAAAFEGATAVSE